MTQDLLDHQRARLTGSVVARIADAVVDAGLPDTLYGLVLAYSLGGFSSYVWPLYEVTRQALLEAGEKAHGLWDPSWAEDYGLPPGVPDDDALMERNIDVPLYEDEALSEAFWRYCGGPPDNDRTYEAMHRLWRDIAAALTRHDWHGRVEVTDDFVAFAYPMEGSEYELREGLRSALGPERYREFEAKGWIPVE